ncbi:SWI/SNF and RSC complex subunit Ssr3 [Rhodotorula kratochvilovae]
MAYPPTPQQQQAIYAQLHAQQHPLAAKPPSQQHQLTQAQAQYAQMQAQALARAGGNPQLQAQQLRAMSQAAAVATAQQQGGAQAVPAAAAPAAAPPAGVSTRERDVGDGDDHYRNAKRRKPTDRSLPNSFTPALPPSIELGASDTALASSLDSLDKLGDAYKRLQDIERKVDWTVARKAVEVAEKVSGAGGRGEPLRRTLRIHVTATARDQPWQLSADELAKEGDKDAVPATEVKTEGGTSSEAKVRVPRVEVRITGEVLEDERYPASSTPFTTFLHRLVLETPARDPSVTPSGSQPLSWTRPRELQPGAKLPSALECSHPLSAPQAEGAETALRLRLALYVSHPAGERYALHPELASVLDTSEADRVGVLEALWAYAKSKGLVVEGQEGGAAGAAKSGIKTDDRLKKFFGNVPLVAFHHLPEYLNRLLLAPPPRQFALSIPLSAATSSSPQHFAFDTPLYVSSPVQPALDSASRALSALNSPASSLAAELQALDDKLALNALSARQHAAQLHALLGFARDPVAFLERFVATQAGSLDHLLSASATGGPGALAGGSDGVLGARWRDEIRHAETWDRPWVREAVDVWALRDAEGAKARLRQQQQQQQVQQQMQQAQMAQMQAGMQAGAYARR